MAEENVDDALSEIQKILEMLSRNKEKALAPEIAGSIISKLDELENKVDSFKDETDDLLSSLGMTKSRMAEVIKEVPADISGDEKEALKKALELKKEVLKMREEFAKEAGVNLQPLEKENKIKKKTEKKLSKSEHRKKYKRLGSRKKWKPL